MQSAKDLAQLDWSKIAHMTRKEGVKTIYYEALSVQAYFEPNKEKK